MNLEFDVFHEGVVLFFLGFGVVVGVVVGATGHFADVQLAAIPVDVLDVIPRQSRRRTVARARLRRQINSERKSIQSKLK